MSVYQPFPTPIQLPDTPVCATLWQSTKFLWSTPCLWYHRDAENTGNMRTNFPCGLLSVAIGAWTNPCVSNTTIRGERHYPVENNNPGIGCSVHCTFSSLEEDVETDTQLSAMQYILPAANIFWIKKYRTLWNNWFLIHMHIISDQSLW